MCVCVCVHTWILSSPSVSLKRWLKSVEEDLFFALSKNKIRKQQKGGWGKNYCMGEKTRGLIRETGLILVVKNRRRKRENHSLLIFFFRCRGNEDQMRMGSFNKHCSAPIHVFALLIFKIGYFTCSVLNLCCLTSDPVRSTNSGRPYLLRWTDVSWAQTSGNAEFQQPKVQILVLQLTKESDLRRGV